MNYMRDVVYLYAEAISAILHSNGALSLDGPTINAMASAV